VPGSVRGHFKGYGGVLSFVTEPARAKAMLTRLELATPAPSLGGPETLVTLPATTSHSGVPREARAAMGIEDGLVRVACGLEDIGDLIADFEQALG
jgi:cystathionine beta-lyase/cystathionine gamma-synthase